MITPGINIISLLLSLSLAGLEVSALEVEILQEDLVVQFHHAVYFVVLFDWRESDGLSTVLKDHYCWKLFGETWDIDVEFLGELRESGDVDL